MVGWTSGLGAVRRITSTATSASTSTRGTCERRKRWTSSWGCGPRTDFTFQGEFYEVKDLTIAPRPVQQPHPPVYLAVSRTPASVDVAVSRDLPITTSFSTPEADKPGLFSLYAERCAAAGKDLPVAEMPYFRFVYLDEDERVAREYPRESLTWVRDLAGYRRTLSHGDEINVDLDHWRNIRTVEPASYESELEGTVTSARRRIACSASRGCGTNTASATLAPACPLGTWSMPR